MRHLNYGNSCLGWRGLTAPLPKYDNGSPERGARVGVGREMPHPEFVGVLRKRGTRMVR